jgi:hypothetical protein
MHNTDEVRDVLAAFEAVIPLATLVSPAHRQAFKELTEAVQTFVDVCAVQRPSGEEMTEAWQTLRDLPAGRGWRSDVETAASLLGIEVPSWTPPDEAFEMLAALREAAQHVVFAICRPARGGGFAPPSANKEAEHIAGANKEIEKALAKAKALGLVG